jgi:hypothetical protein
MSRPVIDLTDEQLAIVHEYTDNIPLRWQRRYLAGIRAQLAAAPVLTNRVVLEACANTARATMLGSGAVPTLDDED